MRALGLALAACVVAGGGVSKAEAATQPVAYAWKSVQIQGGGFVSGLLFHPTSPGLLYARTDVGGVYSRDTGAGQWTPLTDWIDSANSQLDGVVAFAVDPHDPNRLYLACGQYLAWWAEQGVVFASTDRGATWTQATLPVDLGGNSDGRNTGERLAVDPNDGSILFLGTNQNGLYRSADRGATWTPMAGLTEQSLTFVAFDPRGGSPGSATQTIYAGVNDTGGSPLYRSTDGGTTWTPVAGAPSGLIPQRAAIDATNGLLYLTFSDVLGPNGATTGAVWKLDLTAGTWTNISPPAGQGGFAGLSMDAEHPATLLVSTLDRWSPRDEIYRSIDGGATWRGVLAANGQLDTTDTPWATGHTPHWIGCVAIDPFNSDHAVFNTGFGMFTTHNLTAADSGGTVVWTFTDKNLEETVPLALSSPSAGAYSLVSALGDIGGFRHSDLDATPQVSDHFSTHTGTNDSIDCAAQKPSFIVRTFSDVARGCYSTDSGSTWTDFPSQPTIPSSNTYGIVAVAADALSIVWMPSGMGAYVSNDNGSTWKASGGSPVNSSDTFYPVADKVNPSKYYIFDYSAGKFYRSTDGGVTFSVGASGLPTTNGVPATSWTLEGDIWLPLGDSGLYHSADSGATFMKIAAGVSNAYQVGTGKAAPGQSIPAVFIAGVVNGVRGLFRSDDGGISWVQMNDSQHQFGWMNQICGDPRVYGRVYLATGGRGVIYGDIAPLAIQTQPSPIGAAPGSSATFSVNATGAAQYQWSKDGTAIPGATAASFTIAAVSASDVGSYAVTVTGPAGSLTSTSATLTMATAITDKLTGISTRAFVGTGNDIMVAGFTISGTQPKSILIRASGPGLTGQLPAGTVTLPDPVIKLYDLADPSSPTMIGSDDNWDSSAAAGVAAAAKRVGEFAWTPGSTDAAMLVTLRPGSYTVEVSDKNNASGISLVEVYDADTAPTASKLIGISTRAYVKTGAQIEVAGFAVGGASSKRFLIRASGPALGIVAPYLAASVLPDPMFNLYAISSTGMPTLIGQNDNWPSNQTYRDAFTATGEYPFPDGSKDAALIATLQPGLYTSEASDVAGGVGIAIVEVYEYP